MRRYLLAVGIALVALVALWPVAGSSAQTNQPALEKYGWWNVNQALPADPTGGLLPPAVTVPAPPTAPPDGLYVEQGANGVAAIAAVNYYTGGGVDASLTLALAEGALSEDVTLAACPAGGGWDAAQNGRWDQRPTYDPANCKFLGTAHPDTVTFSIPEAAHEPGSGFLAVVIVPSEGSGIFRVSFEPPMSKSLVTTPSSASVSPPSASPTPAYTPLPLTFGSDAYEAPTFGPSLSVTTPVAAGNQSARARTAARSPRPDTQGSDRAVAILLLVGGAVAAVPKRWLPRPWSSADRMQRGLGRFARDRTAPPNRV